MKKLIIFMNILFSLIICAEATSAIQETPDFRSIQDVTPVTTTQTVAPDGFEAISGIGEIMLQWFDPHGDIQGFRINRKPGFPGQKFREIYRKSEKDNIISYIDQKVSLGKKYTYSLQAIDKNGNYSQSTQAITVIAGVAVKEVDSNGGTVKFGDCEIIFGKDAFNPSQPSVKTTSIIQKERYTVKITKASSKLPVNRFATSLGPNLQFTLADSSGKEVITKFHDNTTTLKFDYSKISLPAGYNKTHLGVYYYNKEIKCWEKLENVFNDLQKKCLVVKLTHFSEYQVALSEFESPSLQSYYELGVSPFLSHFQNNTEAVNTSSGSLTVSCIDLKLPGRAGFDLVLERNYDSTAAQHEKIFESNTNENVFRQVPVETFSCGWSLNIPWIEETNKGKFLRLPDGQTIKIELTNNQFEYHTGIHFILFGLNTLLFKDGIKFEFDSSGKAIRKIDPSGKNKITYEYNGKELFRIIDSLGRNIEFTYQTIGSKRFITEIKAGSHTLRYEYINNVLSGVYDPMNRKTTYGYITSGLQSGYRVYDPEIEEEFKKIITHNLVLLNKITYPTGGTSNYFYDFLSQNYTNPGSADTFYGYKVIVKKKVVEGKEINYYYTLNNAWGMFLNEYDPLTPPNTYILSCKTIEGDKTIIEDFEQVCGTGLVVPNQVFINYKGALITSRQILINNRTTEFDNIQYFYDVPIRALDFESHSNDQFISVFSKFDSWGNLVERRMENRIIDLLRNGPIWIIQQ